MSEPSTYQRTRVSTSEAARTAVACITCRDRKIKCSGTRPCRFCAKRRQDCVFPDNARGKKKLYDVAYIESLERQVAASAVPATPLPRTPVHLEQPPTRVVAGSDSQSEKRSILTPEPVMTSSLRFGTRIKDLSKGVPTDTSSPVDAYNLLEASADSPPLQWPTQERAYDLFETFLNSLSIVQHLLDPRAFSDRIATMFADGEVQRPIGSLWELEFVLVMAVGELREGAAATSDPLPGCAYFRQAIACLPQVGYLRTAGTIGIEIMGLIAFYLQCADCKEDAYIYAGLGLRLAMANDMARQDSSQRTSDAIHRNRLWWTIYMQERRLAAATGNPPGIPDDAITTPMPCKTSLFSSPDALITNINLARITGQITQDIYGRRHENDKDFIVKTQTILTSLLDIRKSMPVQFAVDLSDETRKFSRTGATLYLMLFQAIMFVTRPILLHKARAHVKGAVRAEDATGSDSDLLDRFCSVCVDAATNTLTTLRTVKAQGIIAKFGFFDLDAIFSAAFVFVLTAVSPVHASRRIVELRSAISLLEYLSSVGNKAAGNRLVDISQMCARLDIDLSPGTERDTAQQEAPPWEGIEVLLEGETGIHMSEVGNLDFTSSFWLDQSFALDGTVETDWEELERMATHDDEG